MKWTKKELKETIELVKNGLSYNEISEITKRPGNAIRIKMNRIGFKVSDYQHKSVKYCVNCGGLIKNYGDKFCSHKCSAIYNNKNRKVIKYCVNCGVEIPKVNTYCSQTCQSDYNRKELYTKIEMGDTTLSSYILKKYMVDKYGDKCMECGWCETNPTTGNVPIEMEHIDGNSENNSLSNLKLLCPNCHSLTPTYKALNKGNGRHKRRERYHEGKSF